VEGRPPTGAYEQPIMGSPGARSISSDSPLDQTRAFLGVLGKESLGIVAVRAAVKAGFELWLR